MNSFNSGIVIYDHMFSSRRPCFVRNTYLPLQVMFAERVPWDGQGTYRRGNLDVYFEYIDEKGNNWLQQGESRVCTRELRVRHLLAHF